MNSTIKTIKDIYHELLTQPSNIIQYKYHDNHEILALKEIYDKFHIEEKQCDSLIFIHCISGKFQISDKDGIQEVSPQDTILIPYMTHHQIKVLEETETLTLFVSGRYVVQNISWFPYVSSFYQFNSYKLTDAINQIYKLMDCYSKIDRFGFNAALDTFFYEYYLKISELEADNIPNWQGNFPQIFTDILLYVHKNYTRPITLADLSQHYPLSPQHISRLFKKYMNQTYKEYLDYLRLEHAVYLIINTDDPLIKILYDAGFPNKKSFARIFEAHYNMLPSEFRKQHHHKI